MKLHYYREADSLYIELNPKLSADSRFHQNGKSNDGWVPPARGNMVQPAAQ